MKEHDGIKQVLRNLIKLGYTPAEIAKFAEEVDAESAASKLREAEKEFSESFKKYCAAVCGEDAATIDDSNEIQDNLNNLFNYIRMLAYASKNNKED